MAAPHIKRRQIAMTYAKEEIESLQKQIDELKQEQDEVASLKAECDRLREELRALKESKVESEVDDAPKKGKKKAT